MKKTLIVVDMQNDFIDMALGTKEAVAIVSKVKEKIQEYVQNGDEIIFTRDTHTENYLQTPEGKKLPVEHCIQRTRGWQIADGLYVEGCKIIDKPNFGWPNWQEEHLEEIREIAINELGMVYATAENVVLYKNTNQNYVTQYEKIPQEEDSFVKSIMKSK